MKLAAVAFVLLVLFVSVSACASPRSQAQPVASLSPSAGAPARGGTATPAGWERRVLSAPVIAPHYRYKSREAEEALARGDRSRALEIARQAIADLLPLGRFEPLDPRLQELHDLSRLLNDHAATVEDRDLAGRAYERWREHSGGGYTGGALARAGGLGNPGPTLEPAVVTAPLPLQSASTEALAPLVEPEPQPVVANDPPSAPDPSAHTPPDAPPPGRGIDDELLLNDDVARARKEFADSRDTVGPDAPETLARQAMLARLLASKKRFEEAQAEYEAIVAAYERLLASMTEPIDPRVRRGRVEAGLDYSRMLAEAGKPSQAFEAASGAAAAASDLPGDDSLRDEALERHANAADEFAREREQNGDLAGAQSALVTALGARQRIQSGRGGGLQLSRDRLAALLRVRTQKLTETQQQGNGSAVEVERQDILAAASMLPPDDSFRIETEDARIAELQQSCRFGEARLLCEQRLRDLESAGSDARSVDEARRELAALLRVMGRRDEARAQEALLHGSR